MHLHGPAIAGILLASAGLWADPVAPAGWHLSSPKPKDYQADRDTGVRHGGQASAAIWALKDKPKGFATVMQGFRCGEYRGKRVRLSAWVRTQNAGAAQLWMRIDSFGGTEGFDNMQSRPITGTREWTQANIVLDVPKDAIGIMFGLILQGSGKTWLDDVVLEVVNDDVPVTSRSLFSMPEAGPQRHAHERMIAGYAEKPTEPVNLDFEQTETAPAPAP